MLRIPIITTIAILTLSACQKEVITISPPIDDTTNGYDLVDERLWIYFNSFEEEAVARGLDVNLRSARISGTIENIDEENIAGSCHFNRFQPGAVTIDLNFWDRSTFLAREFVVFHELGHCALWRDHEDSSDQFGRCISIMRSGLGDCRDNYSLRTRKAYLDELFSKTGGLQ